MRGITLALLLLAAAPASAQIPVFYGALDVQTGAGRIDPDTGQASVKVHRWRFRLSPESNGIFPDREPILIEVGTTAYPLPAGMMKVSRNGRVFTYRGSRRAPAPAVRLMRIKQRTDGWYGVELAVTGVDLDRMMVVDPVCLAAAFTVGDDHSAAGANFTRRNFFARHLRVDGDCPLDHPHH